MSLDLQFNLFIHIILYGIFLGITFDCATILKNDLKHEYLKISLMVLFWILQSPLIYIYIYNINDGIFHFYIIIFIILGAFVYFKWMKHLFRRDLEIFGKNIYIILRFLKKCLNILVISPILFIYKFISDIIKRILKLLKFIIFTPFVKIIKRISKKKVKQRVKKAKGNQTK